MRRAERQVEEFWHPAGKSIGNIWTGNQVSCRRTELKVTTRALKEKAMVVVRWCERLPALSIVLDKM